MRHVLLPLMDNRLSPGPMMLILAARSGRYDWSRMVPVTFANVTVPPPALLALISAWRNDPAPESAVVVTAYWLKAVLLVMEPASAAMHAPARRWKPRKFPMGC